MYASRHYTGSDPAGSNEQHGSIAAQRMSAVRFLKSPDAIALTTAVCASDPTTVEPARTRAAYLPRTKAFGKSERDVAYGEAVFAGRPIAR